MGVSGNLWIVVKDVKTLVVYEVESEKATDSMKGNKKPQSNPLALLGLFMERLRLISLFSSRVKGWHQKEVGSYASCRPQLTFTASKRSLPHRNMLLSLLKDV